ncbi:glycoside hydrolase family 13 protein, partial [Hydnomerulius pinastri MD-312]
DPHYIMVTSLNQARKAAIDSEKYFLTTPMQFLDANEGNTLAVSKPPVLALFTNAGSSSATSVRWNVTHPIFKSREQLVDVLTCRNYLSGENGGVSIQSDEGMPKVLMPISSIQGSPQLCPQSVDISSAKRAAGLAVSWLSITPYFLVAVAVALA